MGFQSRTRVNPQTLVPQDNEMHQTFPRPPATGLFLTGMGSLS